MSDFPIFTGMAVAIGLGAWGAIKNDGLFRRVGSVVSAFTTCVGLAYFGWRPYFGGAHDIATYFGCVMLTLGLLAWLLFRGRPGAGVRANPDTPARATGSTS